LEVSLEENPNIINFLNSYNDIEDFLKRLLNQDDLYGKYLLESARKYSRIVEHYYIDISQFIKLRNAIVHYTRNSKVVAIPNDWAVAEIQKIRDLLINPPKLIPVFSKQVIAFSQDESINKPLEKIIEMDISQFPIFSGEKLIGLLNSNSISRWLASSMKEDIISISETPISNILIFAENKNNYEILNRDSTLIDAVEKFHEYQDRGKILEAILICNGRVTRNNMIGIITTYDLSKILKLLH
jgi:predicted transcriptional regulator